MQALMDFVHNPVAPIILVGVIVVLVGAILAFARSRKPKDAQLPPATPTQVPAEAAPEEPRESEVGDSDQIRAGPVADEETAAEGDAGVEPASASEEEPAQEVEVPESIPSRMGRLRARLARSGALGKSLLSLLSRGDLSATDWEEIEDSLLIADLGLDATEELMEALRTRVKVENTSDPQVVRALLREELLKLVGPDMDRSVNLGVRDVDGVRVPATILMVGVNGTGKTTTTGKMARIFRAEGHEVLLGAADTFRAAAADQLETWGSRVGVGVVRSEREGADPASVAFESVEEGIRRGCDIVMVDTAGRLQTKSALMDELGKVKRVMEKHAPVSEVLLVLDATTGQNGLRQAEVFAEVAGVTGIVLSKLDGSAKGGIVVSVQRTLGVPVKFVGLGEGPDDLAPFDPNSFVDAIVG
ncbi:cell division protein FtsY [Actinomyces sp. S6-Spd3]|uniref:signal recognition particle-docking protein FtsY n=1 Tax=Actinomyces sp. S6-Spd3 TaxID=1284680 RepID=UPI00050F4CF4|nr:signal recognition particle-docking protein FtsY [Actinomyces sp. S6-Spd3]KGF00510.1 cell division protein FtsY [Actinomyces sp. S6-Spd3]